MDRAALALEVAELKRIYDLSFSDLCTVFSHSSLVLVLELIIFIVFLVERV